MDFPTHPAHSLNRFQMADRMVRWIDQFLQLDLEALLNLERFEWESMADEAEERRFSDETIASILMLRWERDRMAQNLLKAIRASSALRDVHHDGGVAVEELVRQGDGTSQR